MSSFHALQRSLAARPLGLRCQEAAEGGDVEADVGHHPRSLDGCRARQHALPGQNSAIGVATFTAISASGQTIPQCADPALRGGDPKDREVASLLALARKAMSEAEWETADQLIAQAESQHVQFGKLHFGDTPEKARRDLEKSRPAETPPGKQATAGKRGKESTSEIPPANHVVSPSSSTAAPGTIRCRPTTIEGDSAQAGCRSGRRATNCPDQQAFPPTSKNSPRRDSAQHESVRRRRSRHRHNRRGYGQRGRADDGSSPRSRARSDAAERHFQGGTANG